MDDLTLLRTIRETAPTPQHSLDVADGRLNAILLEAKPAPAPRFTRRFRWAGGVTAVATAVAAVLVLGHVTGTVGSSPAASAAEVLDSAADLSASAVDFHLNTGQYLKIATRSELLVRVGPSGPGDGSARDINGWIDKSGDILYVPADRSADWVWVRENSPENPDGSTTRFFGTGGEQARADELVARKPSAAHTVLTLPGGNYRGAVDDPTLYNLGPDAETATMPRDGKQLLTWYREHRGESGEDSSADWNIFEVISGSLRWNLVPADLRAAMFRAIALMPDITLGAVTADHNNPSATLVMTKGGYRQELTLNTTTGLVTATAQYGGLRNSDGTSIYPPETPTFLTTVTTTVVNTAP